MKDKISIITTYYNSENYILKCINSINSQVIEDSFDLEYIIVDDCSTDNSPYIVDIFFEKYKNEKLTVNHIKTPRNIGCGGARRLGIESSSGNYLMFLDADDYYINYDFVKRAYDIISKNNADIVEFGFKYIDNEGQRVNVVSPKKYIIQNSIEGNMFAMFYDNMITFMPWTKIIKKSLVDTKRYSDSKVFEDIRTTPYWVSNAQKIIVANTVEINYRAVKNSIIREDPYATRLGTVEAISELFSYFKSNKNILKSLYDRCMPDLRTLLTEDSDTEYFKKMSKLNTYMLSYIYPKSYKEITYDIE